MKEIRAITTPAKVEIREDGEIGKIYGYPIVYNRDSEDMGFIERIAPGAAKKALETSDIRALKNHDPNLIFGRSGVNLTFKEDKDGLQYEATPIDTDNYRTIAKEINAGLLTGQSFGFTILSDEWTDLDTDKPQRTITEIGEIFDVGPVTYPAYTDTSVALRSLEKAKENPEENKPKFKLIDPVISITASEGDFDFIGYDSFDRAVEKIEELRLASKPTLPDADDSDDEPTLDTSADTTKEELFSKITEIEERYKE